MTPPAPHLSIVLVARNDNYSGDFNDRLHNCMHWLTSLVEMNKLPTELLIVDYNPVQENEPLINMLDWPKNRKYLTIRLLHVPNETHKALINPAVRKTVPLFEFNAKNMGIRRAKGEYILCTNADILFHPSIIRYIAQGIPDKKHYYRADRYDYKKIDSYDFKNTSATLRKIQQKVFRLMLKGYAYEIKRGENFIEETLYRIKNYRRLMIDRHLVKFESFASKWTISINYDGFLMKYHTHCAGDFMMMHRDHWMSLHGYPEDTYISTHCDAMFTVMASALGLKEKVLRWPAYHQDHERRYNTDVEQSTANKEMMDMFKRVMDYGRSMEATRKPKIVNPPDWGHGSENFAETII